MSSVPDFTKLTAQTITSNYTTVAFVMILLYDYVLTFGDEVEFVWKQRTNLGKILFLLNRYVPLIDLVILMNTYTNRAITLDEIDNWMGVFSIAVIDLILLLRTWALWKRSRRILVFLSTLLVLCILAASGATLYASLTVIRIPSLNNIRPCESDFPRTDVFYAVWVSFILFDTTVMALTLIRTIPALKLQGSTPILAQLLKDGTQYFVMIFVASLANVMVINLAPPAQATMLFVFYRVMTATLGSRLVLNLRGSLLRPGYNEEETTTELNMVVLTIKDYDQPARDSMEDIEDPAGAASRRQHRNNSKASRGMHHISGPS